MNTEFIQHFSDEERARIVEVELQNPGNERFNIPGGNATKDKVFLLNSEEIERYLPHKKQRYGKAIPLYAKSHPHFVITEDSLGDYYTRPMLGNCNYWLRSPGSQPNCASMIDFVGQIGLIGTVNHELPIRPAMFISINGQKVSKSKETQKSPAKEKPMANNISERELLEKSKPIVEQYYHDKITQDDVLKLLKESSISVNGTWEATGEKTCLLSVAVKNKDRELIDYLLDNGCDVNTETYITDKRYG